MAITFQGNAGVVTEVDTTHRAIRMTGRPMEVGTRGAYGLGVTSGIMAAGLAGTSEIFQMRWIHATQVCILRSITFNLAQGTTAFAAGVIEISLTVARSWSADGSAGTAVVMSTANTNKKRTDFALSSFSDTGIRFSATAALGAGTKTLDTNKLATFSAFVSSAAGTAAQSTIIAPGTMLWQRNTTDEYPLLLEQNEGIVVRATVPATGTWQYSTSVEWAEVDPTAVTGW